MAPSLISVQVHVSLSPENERQALLDGLRSRRIAPKFHYQSYKQAELWLALHHACSPAWRDPNIADIYEASYATAAQSIRQEPVSVIGLGCGNGYKEARLLRLLAPNAQLISYVPCDVSLPLVLAAADEARAACPTLPCQPLLCDLSRTTDLPAVLDQAQNIEASRLITFFGMLPNLEPDNILPKLASVLRPGDILLLSANLAPGPDYRAGAQRVLPGYDNAETRAWLFAFLADLGVEPSDGVIGFSIEESCGLLRIAGDYRLLRDRSLTLRDEQFTFRKSDVIRLFFSYRHTPDLVRQLLQPHGLSVMEEWISSSEEEGVFLCQRSSQHTNTSGGG